MSKDKKKYITLKDGGVDFRKMAKLMSDSGHKMNHATARNQMILAIEQLFAYSSSKLSTKLTKSQIKDITDSQHVQNSLQDVLHLAYERYLENESKNHGTK